MDFEKQIIFFLSALGAFNGFILCLYFAVNAKKKKFVNYFLVFLLLMLSIRIIKSVFFYFNTHLSNIYIQIGLSACILIGPFLYLYLKATTRNQRPNWIIHILPYLVGITILGTLYPYVENRNVWSKWIVRGIYFQWFIYIALSFKFIKPFLTKLIEKKNLKSIDIWLLSVYFGGFIIWLAYSVGAYTSYIVGALSFSFVLYLIALLLIFKNTKNSTFFEEQEKYKNKQIDRDTLKQIEDTLSTVIQNELFLNPNLTLRETAKNLNVSKHTLSQYLNEKLGKSFSVFINEHRIEKAKEFLKTENNLTIETLGYDSGFNSKSTFYSTFKKITGQTPAEYRQNLGL